MYSSEYMVAELLQGVTEIGASVSGHFYYNVLMGNPLPVFSNGQTTPYLPLPCYGKIVIRAALPFDDNLSLAGQYVTYSVHTTNFKLLAFRKHLRTFLFNTCIYAAWLTLLQRL